MHYSMKDGAGDAREAPGTANLYIFKEKSALSYYNKEQKENYRTRRNRDSMNNTRTNRPAGPGRQNGGTASAGPAGAQLKIERLQKRVRRLRSRSLTAAVLAVLLLAASVIGSRAASENEQQIRLSLGQKNYALEGEEGPVYFAPEYKDAEDLREDSAERGRDIVREGIVLLRNEEDVLPLRKGASISVFGKAAVEPVLSSSAAVTAAESFKDALEEEKLRVNDKLWDFMDRGGGNSFSGRVEKSFEEYSEAAVVVIGRSGSSTDFNEPAYAEGSGEQKADSAATENAEENAEENGETAAAAVTAAEAAPEEETEEVPAEVTGAKALQLTQQERELLAYVRDHFDRIIVILNTENPMETGFLDEFGVKACLWTGGLGQNGIRALAEVMSGKVNPSGGLPDTFVYNSMRAPAAANLGDYTIRGSKTAYGDKYLAYSEGMYVGYRYYETRYEDTVLGTSSRSAFDYAREVAYPFGFGLSYTEFELKNMKMELGKKGYEVTVEVHNTGSREGKEVVQVYLQKPYTKYAAANGIEVPSVELAGFAKTRVIQPGEFEKVKIVLTEEAFKSFDTGGKGTYVIDAGTYLVTTAQDAHAAVNNILMYKGKARSEALCGSGDGGLVEKVEFARDNKTYAVSAQTKAPVRRVFEQADPASFDSDYQVLSRGLWTSTWPQTWKGGIYPAPSSFQELLAVSSGEDSNASAPVYNNAHGEKNAGLAELRETAFDDYRWGSLLDQLTWRETYSLVRKGGGLVNEVLSCTSPQALISGGGSGIEAGYSGGRGFVYPSAPVLAATWNTDLIQQAAQLIGEEALKAGVTFWKMPSLNLHRTAMGGRNCDSFSEDSYLTGKMAAAMCRGLSGKGVIPVLGRFVLADQETNYTGVAVMCCEQAVRELYLRPFEIALRDGGAGLKAVMAGMNRLGPRWCGGHAGLLTDVLRGEWGFAGIVMTDTITARTDDYADILEGLEAGTDLWQNTSNSSYRLRGGQLTYGVRARFRTAAGRILQTISRSNAMNGIGTETTMTYKSPRWKLIRTVLVIAAVLVSLACLWYALRQAARARSARARLAVEKREYARSRRKGRP